MAQGFDCFCGAEKCRGFISGAKNMTREQLEGNFLNAHIRSMLEERDGKVDRHVQSINGDAEPKDATEQALQAVLKQAIKSVQTAQYALDVYRLVHRHEVTGGINGGKRRGVTSRELSGEMGGDTTA